MRKQHDKMQQTRANMTQQAKTYNVVIIDDHPVLWDALRLLIEQEPRFRLTATCLDGTEIIGTAALKKCDIMVLDLALPLMDGFSVLEKVWADHPRIAVLVFTMHNNIEFFNRCIANGARGYVLKSDPPEVLLNALKNISAGKMGISPAISPMRDARRDIAHNGALAKLTQIELDVLSLVAGGMTSRDVARSLNMKKTAVDRFRKSMNEKLGTNKISDLICIAKKNRLL